MDFVIPGQSVILYLCIGVFVVGLLSVLLKKGEPWKRGVAMAIVVLVCAVVLFLFYKSARIRVDDQGITMDLGGRISIPWEGVRTAALVENLSATPYAPRVKTFGNSMGGYKLGWFILANGRKAYVRTESGDRALVIETADVMYVLGVSQTDAIAAAVAAHVTVTKEMGGKK
jgi:Ca2+/Na+ antiporter